MTKKIGKTKLYLTLMLGITLLLYPLYLGVHTVIQTSSLIDFMKKEQVALSEIAFELNNDLHNNHAAILRVIIHHSTQEIQAVQKSFNTIDTTIKKLNTFNHNSHISDKNLQTVSLTINRRFIGYKAIYQDLLEALKKGNKDDINDVIIGYNSVLHKFDTEIHQLVSITTKELQNNISRADKNIAYSIEWIFISFIVALLLIVASILHLISQHNEIELQLKRAEKAEAEAKALQEKLKKHNDNLESEIEAKTQELHTKIYTNFISHQPNRNQLLADIHQSIYTMVAILDIDKFQQFNDAYGEKVGNSAIRLSSEYILRHIKERNYRFYHTSGDEFVVASMDNTLEDRAMFLDDIKNILHSYKEHKFTIDTLEFNLNLTAGISFYGEQKIIAYADMSLKDAKKRNVSLAIFDQDAQLEQLNQQRIECHKKLLRAFESDRLISFFQPIVPIQDTSLPTKYESLVRIVEDGEIIPPLIFIDVAKNNRLYPRLTQTVFNNTLKTIQEYQIPCSLNISIDDINNNATVALLFNTFKTFKYNHLVTIELLETEDFEDYNKVEHFCKQIRSYGIKIALDDFGSGYSNFSHILNLPIDSIKIDASLIANIDRDNNARLMVETIVGLAKKLNVTTTAEFVASKEIFEVVKSLGIDYAQGFYLGRPDYIQNHIEGQ